MPLHNVVSRELSTNPKQSMRTRQRPPAATASPEVKYTAHNRGNIQLAIANNGTFGTFGETIVDPLTGDFISSCVYPRNSDILYLYVGAFWIGAVVGRDTLVSCGSEDFYETSEFWPEPPPLGDFRYQSIDINSPFYAPEALSEQDILAEYTDTLVDPQLTGRDATDGRNHKPLGIKISQRSMAWSYAYADDFILFDFKIENIGTDRLRKLYIGIWIDGDVWHVSRRGPIGWEDDIVGYYPSHQASDCRGHVDSVNIAWTADNDGDPVSSGWDFRSPTSVVGARVVRAPSDSLQMSFNWWITNYTDASFDFGPRRAGTPEAPYRNFGARMGTPEGDRNKYYVMSKPEFDYDLLFTAVDQQLQGWLPPPADAVDIADGFDTRYLLSFGPFDIDPGQTLPLTLAWVGGENFHRDPAAFEDLWDPHHPDRYYESLDFSGLARNSRWASWIYDNPGVDTDGDGYRGRFDFCGDPGQESSDTFWYEGDGVPDFRGASPPPAPKLRVIPEVGKLTLRWNGYYSETTEDVFLGEVDFEGYRVYAALDDRPSSFSVLRSYDREDYNRYTWREPAPGQGRWELVDVPFTLDSLRSLYHNPSFDPLTFNRNNPLRVGDSLYFFEAQDFNQSDISDPIGIRKAYPDAVDPGLNPADWREEDVTYEHGERLPKYYEYEYVLENLLPTVSYYASVTAFDFGSPIVGLPALETPPINSAIEAYPQVSSETVVDNRLEVYTYPNPYRIDGAYARRGFENRQSDLPPERARRIHFANLPPVCTISIYSLDGDLIQTVRHNFPQGGPTSQHDVWDLTTRNGQTAVSGLYYFVVESPGRTQIGKLVIVK